MIIQKIIKKINLDQRKNEIYTKDELGRKPTRLIRINKHKIKYQISKDT
jgi:hypothetical protein